MDPSKLSDVELEATQRLYQKKARRHLNSDPAKRQVLQDRLDRINNEMRKRGL